MPFKIQLKKSNSVKDKFVSTIFCGHCFNKSVEYVQKCEEKSEKEMVDFNVKGMIFTLHWKLRQANSQSNP
jgi:hypothetical protein